jgi:putative membrane protein
MPAKLKEFLERWAINTVAVLVATYVVPGIHYQRWLDLLGATFILGMLNTFVKPLMMLLSLPLLIFTLGLFMLFINAALLVVVSWLLSPRFHVDHFGHALLGAVIISLVSLTLNSLTGTGHSRVEFRRKRPPPPGKSDDGGGPVIDV